MQTRWVGQGLLALRLWMRAGRDHGCEDSLSLENRVKVGYVGYNWIPWFEAL